MRRSRMLAPVRELAAKIHSLPEFQLVPIYTHLNGTQQEQEKWRGVVEKGTTEVVAVVSNKYSLVQMREVFSSVLEEVASQMGVEGDLLYHRGRGLLFLFPLGEEVGICVRNSVDTSSAIAVNFVLREGGIFLHAPAREWRRIHVGDPLTELGGYAKILAEAKDAWVGVVYTLSRLPLTADLLREIRDAVGEVKYLREKVEDFASNGSLAPRSAWDLLLALCKEAAGRRYSTPLHREERLRELSTLLITLFMRAM
ncbi:MAG: hypothetical protein QXR87_04240 [Candidatus Hadarchaeales archaeon]